MRILKSVLVVNQNSFSTDESCQDRVCLKDEKERRPGIELRLTVPTTDNALSAIYYSGSLTLSKRPNSSHILIHTSTPFVKKSGVPNRSLSAVRPLRKRPTTGNGKTAAVYCNVKKNKGN